MIKRRTVGLTLWLPFNYVPIHVKARHPATTSCSVINGNDNNSIRTISSRGNNSSCLYVHCATHASNSHFKVLQQKQLRWLFATLCNSTQLNQPNYQIHFPNQLISKQIQVPWRLGWIYCYTRSLQAPTSSWRPFKPLAFVFRALWMLRLCDPCKWPGHTSRWMGEFPQTKIRRKSQKF